MKGAADEDFSVPAFVAGKITRAASPRMHVGNAEYRMALQVSSLKHVSA
jgi:hypothetical protein